MLNAFGVRPGGAAGKPCARGTAATISRFRRVLILLRSASSWGKNRTDAERKGSESPEGKETTGARHAAIGGSVPPTSVRRDSLSPLFLGVLILAFVVLLFVAWALQPPQGVTP